MVAVHEVAVDVVEVGDDHEVEVALVHVRVGADHVVADLGDRGRQLGEARSAPRALLGAVASGIQRNNTT